MNHEVNRIGDIYRFAVAELGVPTQVLYPGDRWNIGDPRSSVESIDSYDRDFEKALTSTPDESQLVPLAKLQEIAKTFLQRVNRRNNRVLLRAIPPSVIRLSDLAVNVELSFRNGFVISRGGNPDIITSSDSLAYCMMYDWGGDTLAINGRYEVPPLGVPERFFRIFRVPAHNSAGRSVTVGFMMRQVATRVTRSVFAPQ